MNEIVVEAILLSIRLRQTHFIHSCDFSAKFHKLQHTSMSVMKTDLGVICLPSFKTFIQINLHFDFDFALFVGFN